jgi:hypothetical protein
MPRRTLALLAFLLAALLAVPATARQPSTPASPETLDSWSYVACKTTTYSHAGYYALLESCIGVETNVRLAHFRVTFCSYSIGCDASVKGNIGWDQSHRYLRWANPDPDRSLAGTFPASPCKGCHTSTARSTIWNRTLGAGNFVYGRQVELPLRWPDGVLVDNYTNDSQLCELTVDC